MIDSSPTQNISNYKEKKINKSVGKVASVFKISQIKNVSPLKKSTSKQSVKSIKLKFIKQYKNKYKRRKTIC